MRYPAVQHVDKKQEGSAAVITMLMLPVLIGFMLFSLEASQLLRTRAALGDAAEAAVLASGSINSDNDDKKKRMARHWIEAIATPSGDHQHWLNKVDLDVINCGDNDECEHNAENFEEYRLKVDGQPPRLLTGADTIGFQDQVVAHSASARRHIGSGAKDIYFVADFSGSMYERWADVEKITMLKRLLADMAERLEQETSDRSPSDGKNTIALIPFSGTTHERHTNPEGCPIVQVPYDLVMIPRDFIRKRQELNAVLADMWREKSCHKYTDTGFYSKTLSGGANFYTVPSTTSASVIKDELKRIRPSSWTASYEGIIRAAQLALSGSNAERTIIVLSDGKDSNSILHQAMVEAGYCDDIRGTLDSQRSLDGTPVKSSIAVIAFSYDIGADTPLARCADRGKVYTAHNIEDLKHRILTIIKGSPVQLYRRPHQ